MCFIVITEAPGQIDNSKITVVKNGHQAVKMTADYGQLSESMWRFLVDIYGGGPELLLKQAPTLLSQASSATCVNQEGKVSETGDSAVKV